MLALHRSGESDGRAPLVMVHGFLCAGLFFQPNLATLQRAREVICIDLPGFGESQQVEAVDSIAAMSQQVHDTLTAAGYERYHLLGHSMGGMVALQLAIMMPAALESLIIYASNGSGDLPERFESFAESKARLQRDFAAAKRHICATWLSSGEAHPHFDLLLQCGVPVTLQTAERAIDAMAAFDVRDRLGEIDTDTLIISAELDRTYAERCQGELAEALPRAQRRKVLGCAHCAHLEKEDEFNDILKEWLAPRQ